MYRKLPLLGIEDLSIQRFSGVIGDFVAIYYEMPKEDGPLKQLASQFEKEIINGEIIFSNKREIISPEVIYKIKNNSLPIHRASSTVSELAPIILFLKYIIRPYDTLIIEEPEAHLHPINQRILAKYIVKLIRKKVKIIITTHSEFLLKQLNYYILVNKLPLKIKENKYNIKDDEVLNSSEVSVYHFSKSHNNKYKINKIIIDDEFGISNEEFDNIHDSLYDEKIKINYELLEHTKKGE